MARSLNQVTLMGNLTRDPELRQTPSGQSVTSFSLALNRSYKDASGEWQEATDYVDIVCWGPLAERVAMSSPGSAAKSQLGAGWSEAQQGGSARQRRDILGQPWWRGW